MQDDTFKASRHILRATPLSITGTSSPNARMPISNRGPASTSPAPHPYGVPFPVAGPISQYDAGNSPEQFKAQQGEAPPSQSQQPLPAPGSHPPGGDAHVTEEMVQLFPAEVTLVRTPQDFQAAITAQKRDIEIRSHLDLRNLTLQSQTYGDFTWDPRADRDHNRPRTDLAFVTWPTRSIRGNCTDRSATGATGNATDFKQLYGELSSSRIPLKPLQCLLLTNTNTLNLHDSYLLWLDNLYIGVTQPRKAYDTTSANILATIRLDDSVPSAHLSMYTFVTNITLHGHGLAGVSARMISLTREFSEESLLFQDSIFIDLAGTDAPFLVAFRAYATFSNCLFRNVYLPRSEVFDVSMAGTVTLLNCHFSNISTKNGIVDTSFNNDALLLTGHIPKDYEHHFDPLYDPIVPMYGQDDHEAYDIALSLAPQAASLMYGTEYVVLNKTISDCLYLNVPAYYIMPGCPESDAGRREQRERALDVDLSRFAPSGPGEAPTEREEYFFIFTNTVGQQEEDRTTMHELYGYGYAEPPWVDDFVSEWTSYEISSYSPSPGDDYYLTQYVFTSGEQLSTNHPWFRAVVKVLPTRPAMQSSGEAHFRNGLPLCTDCGDVTRFSPPSPQGAQATHNPVSHGSRNPSRAVLFCVPAACLLCLLALAGGVLVYWRRRMQPGDGAGEEVRRGSRDGAGGSDGTAAAVTAAEASLGQTAVLHAKSMHGSLTDDLKRSTLSQGENTLGIALKVPGLSRQQLGPAVHPQSEYMLQSGLRLAINDTLVSENARETVFHTANKTSEGTSDEDTLRLPNETIFMLQHQAQGLEVQMCSGVDRNLTCLVSTSSQSYMCAPFQSTQAPRMDAGTLGANTAVISHNKVRGLVRQLDRFSRRDLLLGRFELLGPHHRRQGGQALVQFAVDPRDGREFAVKFFLQAEAFKAEAALYTACFPSLHSHHEATLQARFPNKGVQFPPSQNSHTPLRSICIERGDASASLRVPQCNGADDVGDYAEEDHDARGFTDCSWVGKESAIALDKSAVPCGGSRHEYHQVPGMQPGTETAEALMPSGNESVCHASSFWQIPDVVAKFLPQVEAVSDDVVDPRGRPLPPCIIMEKGESLQDWSNRAEPDLFTCIAVLSNVASRMAIMHEAGYAHRDLKPANVMWLPRENRWTVIDFGCVAAIGDVAPLGFTLAYSPPEVVKAHEAGTTCLEVTSALDAWSLGVMSFELLTGAPAFKFLTAGRAQVVACIKGELPLPWEELSTVEVRQLGVFKGPVLQLLRRNPSDRLSMDRFHDLCKKAFSGQSTNAVVGIDTKHLRA